MENQENRKWKEIALQQQLYIIFQYQRYATSLYKFSEFQNVYYKKHFEILKVGKSYLSLLLNNPCCRELNTIQIVMTHKIDSHKK